MLNVTLINNDTAWACMGKQIKVQINGYKMNSRNREVSCSVDIIDVVSKGETVIWSMKNKSGQKGLGNCTDTIFDVIQSPTVQVITLKKDGYCPKSVELAFYDKTKIVKFCGQMEKKKGQYYMMKKSNGLNNTKVHRTSNGSCS